MFHPTIELMFEKWLREAEAAEKLADQFKYDLELKAQYSTAARTLRFCYYDCVTNFSASQEALACQGKK